MRPVVLAAAVALTACGHHPGPAPATSTSAANVPTAAQRERYGVGDGAHVIAELTPSPGAPAATQGRFTAPGPFTVTAACDGPGSVQVQMTTHAGGRERGSSHPFRCGPHHDVFRVEAGAGGEVEVAAFDNRAGHWSVLFYTDR